MTGTPAYSGSFEGHGPANVTVKFLLYSIGYGICFRAMKFDASSLTLVLTVNGIANSTSIAFGTVGFCFVTVELVMKHQRRRNEPYAW